MNHLTLSPALGWPVGGAVAVVLLACAIAQIVLHVRRRADSDETVWAYVRRVLLCLTVSVMALTPSIVAPTNSRAVNATDVVVAVDVTGSMAVKDAQYGSAEQSSRLDVAKQAVKDVTALYPNSSFAALRFGASGTLDVPLTPDSNAIDNWADTLAPEATSVSAGSTLDAPIDQLLLTCKSIHDQHPDDAIVLYLFSDGEQTSSKARRTFSSLRRYLSDAFTVAIGSEQGGNIPVIADGVDGNADQWVTDPDTGKPGVSRMNKDEMASIADELSGTALVLNASNTMRDGVSKEASDKWRVTQTTKKRTRTMPVVWPLAIVTLLLLACELGGLDNSVEEFAMTRTTMKPRASLTVRIVLAVMAALLVMAALWAIVNLAAVNSYNQATQSLQENISTSRKDDADWDKLHTRQQQTDTQFNEASAMKPLLLPQVRESIEHNSHVSSQLTDHASKKIKAEQSDQSASTDSNTADAQESGKSSHKNDENLSDEQRRKIEELLAQNAQSTQSDPNDDSGSAAKKNPSTSSSQTKPW